MLNLRRYFQRQNMKRVFVCISAALAVISSEVQSGAKAPGETCAAADSAYVEVLPFHFLIGDGRDVRSLGERQGMVEWDISLYGYGAKDGMPFWGTANRRGLFPSNLQTGGNRLLDGMGDNRSGATGLMTAGVQTAYLTRPGIVLSGGVSLAGYFTTCGQWQGIADRLYFGVSWKKLHLDIGMKDRALDEFHGLSLTGGDMIYTGNSRNLPGYNLSTDFIYMPWTRNILAFKANFADYMMIDNRYTDKTLLHNEALFLKITPVKFLSLTLGLEMWSQWSGTSPVYGKQPSSFNDYMRVIFGKNGGDDATQSDQINVLGNHLGRELIRLDVNAADFTVTFQHDIPFDDRSGMRFQNFPDGVNTLNFSFKDRDKWVTDILLEFVYTKWQSGPQHDRPATDEELEKNPDNKRVILGGCDNYFNNGEYRSGWTYYGNTIGLPLFTPMPAGEDGKVLGVCNNRVTAWHFGLRGNAAGKVPYKFLFTYSRNFGKYNQSDLGEGADKSIFLSVPEQFSVALESEIPHLGKRLPLSLGIGLYGDFGKLYQNSFGLTVRLSYIGKAHFGK